MAQRLLMLKADGSVLVHSDGGSYKPLNWMTPPAAFTVDEPSDEQAQAGITEVWNVNQTKTGDRLEIAIQTIHCDGGAVFVAGQNVDRADRRLVLATHRGIAVAQGVDVFGE